MEASPLSSDNRHLVKLTIKSEIPREATQLLKSNPIDTATFAGKSAVDAPDILTRMSRVGDNYIFPGQSDHDRLRVISEIHDDQTRELLLRAGFASGCDFVEFGCGMGYITRWAASMGAHAVGIDANEEQVKACQEMAKNDGLTNARFRTASIYEPGIEAETLDIS